MAVLVSALLAPVYAGATDSDLKHSAVLRVKASNGYSILAIVSSERPDGRGQAGLIVYGKRGSATYSAPATITATRVEADLGALGRIALDVIPSGRKKTLRSRCGGEPESFSFEPQLYRGTFEFHGEEGYAEAATGAPREYARFFVDLFCAGAVSGETRGPGLPGARLRVHARSGSFGLSLQANKNRPGARTRFEVETHEKRNGIAISRSTTLRAGAGAFGYDPLLRTATLDPPAPFSGRATFHRGAIAPNRWTGNLTVDLPGRSDVPLTGPEVGATLVPSCWHEGEGRFRC
jgi:hypothetical protein